MADGFLAPTGKFYPKTENFHAQTARAILGSDGQTDEPIQELLRRGYILFVGFHKPGEPENLHADMDYVLGGPGYPATEGQKAWIAEHTEELSRKQQFDINNDETTFENFYISNVRMFPWCKGCAIFSCASTNMNSLMTSLNQSWNPSKPHIRKHRIVRTNLRSSSKCD